MNEAIEEFKKNLLKTINAGIVATNTKDDYSCGMRNGMRWCRALLDDKEPQYEHTPVQPEGGQDDIKIRVIDSNKLIEAINAGSYEINLSAVMALGGVVTQSTSQWIPCSERLPEDGQDVLFCDIDGDIMLGYHVKGRPETHFFAGRNV